MSKLRHILSRTDRSSQAGRQILLSGLAKGIGIVCSLLIIPLTINYVNPTRYGIWLTLSSIISWIALFDLGLGNGFRNRFTESKAKGDVASAKAYTSTTYFAVSCIVLIVFLVFSGINFFIDWGSLLKVDESYNEELRKVFFILSGFFCLNMVANLFTTLLTADQKTDASAWINTAGQALSLLVIWILTRVSSGSLIKLALYFSGIPCFVTLIASILAYNLSSYKIYKPSISHIKLSLVRNVLSLGIRFFVISICMLIIFQMINIVVSRELGPDAVSEYNVAYKYFCVLHSIMLIILTPFWSAFTDAYVKKDFGWMREICKKLEIVCGLFILLGLFMLIISPVVYKIWIGDNVPVSLATSIAVLTFVAAQMSGNVYMFMLNGIGTVRIQMCIYVAFALFAWPVMVWSCRQFGLAGVVIAPTIVCLAQAISGRIQLTKIIRGTARGWWLK